MCFPSNQLTLLRQDFGGRGPPSFYFGRAKATGECDSIFNCQLRMTNWGLLQKEYKKSETNKDKGDYKLKTAQWLV